MDVLSTIKTRETPQMEQARADQVQNSAGGYTFAISPEAQALRFLILGTDSATYYSSAQDLTKQNAQVIFALAANHGLQLVDLIRAVSLTGRVPKQNPTLFALAVCFASPDVETKRAAARALLQVCRTGTHLYIFARYLKNLRGWGYIARRAVASWYEREDVDALAFQAVKYRQREGWSHRDLLRVSHPKEPSAEHHQLFQWILHGAPAVPPEAGIDSMGHRFGVIEGYELAKATTSPSEWARLAADYRLPWEVLPDAALGHREVWEAMLPSMGITALIRNLPRLTNLGLITPIGGPPEIAARLADQEALRKGRVHPLQMLTALFTYSQGKGLRGSQSWTPVPAIVEALDEGFYQSFGALEPANKRTVVACDVSGSMSWGNIAGSPLMPYQAAGAMAMTMVRTEPAVYPMAFSSGFVALPLTKRQRLDDVLRLMRHLPMDSTDCAVPMMWASQNKVEVDTFIVLTDNETWAGQVHPFQALRRYRDIMGINARLIVVGMTATNFTIADPSDPGMLDVVGFDTAAPNLIADFSRGDF